MRRPALARPPRCERPRGPPALTDGPPPETAEYEEDSGARGCVGRARKRRASDGGRIAAKGLRGAAGWEDSESGPRGPPVSAAKLH